MAKKKKSVNNGIERVHGTKGDDALTTSRDKAIVHGFEGDDTVSVSGAATVFGQGGDDVISAGTGRLKAFGGAGDDVILGGDDDDVLNGGHGDDLLVLGEGDDTAIGGKGFDTVVVNGSITDYEMTFKGRFGTEGLKVALTSDSGTDRLKGVEAIAFDNFTFYTDGRNNEVLAGNDSVATDENDVLDVAGADLLANDLDFDGDTLSIASVAATSAAGAVITFDGTTVSYDPGTLFDALAEGETATDSFTYEVTDGMGSIQTATVTVTITGTNDAPVFAEASPVRVKENTTFAGSLTATDVDGTALTYALTGTDAALFTIDPATGAISFVTAPDFEAPANADGDNAYEITVTATDAGGLSDSEDLTVTVTDVLEIDARINEFHYDNAGTDVGEFVEVRVAAGADASVLSVVFYNGSNGAAYRTESLPATPASTRGGYDYYLIELPENGMQNGGSDGLALVGENKSGGVDVLEFLSYEGTLTAVDGPAAGLTSTDIGVAETSSSPIGGALERDEAGDTWSVTESDTRGLDNTYEPFPGRINEIHYDNAGADSGEFIELRVAAGTDVSATTLELYNGNNGLVYDTLSLPSTPNSTSGGYDYYLVLSPGLQNGPNDAIALVNNGWLVEFLSYEGTMTAQDGTAIGETSTDIGVSEASSSPLGFSLQRNEEGDDWRTIEANTQGEANIPAPTGTILINEVLVSTTGADVEFLEIWGTPGTSLAGLSILNVESDDDSGSIDNRFDLPEDAVIGPNGFYLVGNSLVEGALGVTPDAEFPTNFFENSSSTIALVRTASITGTSVTGSETVIDAVALVDPSSGTTWFGAPVLGPDGSFYPSGASRVPDGGAWELVDAFSPAGNNTTPTAAADVILINEVVVSTTGADVEFLEIKGTPGASLAGLMILNVESDDDTGNIDNAFELPADAVIGENGYYLIGNSLVAGALGVTPDAELPQNFFENSSSTIALVQASSVTGTAVTGAEKVLDAVALVDTSAGTTWFDAPVLGPDGSFYPSGAARNADGDWELIDAFSPAGANSTPKASGPLIQISEVLVNTTGSDVEFIEIKGTPGASLAGFTLVNIEGDSTSTPGSFDNSFELPADAVVGDNGYYLIGNDLVEGALGVTPNALIPRNFFENSSSTIALIETASLTGSALTGAERVEDAVALTDGGAGDSFFFDAPVVGPDGSFYPSAAFLNDAGEWEMIDAFSPAGTGTTPTAGSYGPPAEVTAPYAYDFETDFALANWEVYSVDSDAANSWYMGSFSGDSFASVNAFGDDAPADDWLISPSIDISGLTAPVASFTNTKNFDDSGIVDPEVSFLYSTDYTGSGDPSLATWVELPYTASAGGYAETASGEIDLSGVPSGTVTFAFRYESTGTGGGSSSLWQIDDFSVGEATVTPPPPAATTLISTIQGSGAASTLVGQTVTVEAIVVGDFQDGAFGVDGDLNGFYLQEEDADADGNALTSEGIFVYDGVSPGLNVQTGDKVRLTAVVGEFNGETQLSSISAIEVLSSGETLPTAATITFPVASTVTNSDGIIMADLEAYEGMLVTVPDTMTITDLFDLGRYGEMGLSALGLSESFTQANTPDATAFAAFVEEQVRNTLIVDDGSLVQNPGVIPFEIFGETGRIAGEFDAEDELSVGDTATGLTGVLRYGQAAVGFGDEIYRLNLTETPEFVNATPRETSAPDVGGSITVSSFNVLNFFTSLGDEGLDAGGTSLEVRGADNLAELERQTDKLVAALSALDSDIIGLLEIENELGDQNGDGEFAIQYLVDALNADTGKNYTFVDPRMTDPTLTGVGTDAIMVGMIYDADTVALASGTTVELLTDAELAGLGLDYGHNIFEGSGTSRVPLAATFEEIASGETFTVAVNHLKSKGSVSPFGDNAGTGDGSGNNDEARAQAAEALATWLATDPTGSGDTDVLIIGDLNSYSEETPIVYLEGEGYTNLMEAFLGADDFEFSYGFPTDLDTAPQSQTYGALDYALASGSLLSQVTGAAEWHINSLEASIIDYNTNFMSSDQAEDTYNADPYRSSDHDPLIIGLDLGLVVA